MSYYEWSDEKPRNEGDFFYDGQTPDGRPIMGIVQVFVREGQMEACMFLPPNWRGNGGIATLHHGKLDMWTGKWAGPEYGLCCVEV